SSWSQEPQVPEGPTGHHAHVEVGEPNRNQTAPGEKHVALVQKSGDAPGSEAGTAEGRAREAIKLAAGKVTERVAGKRVERKERDIESEDECADANAEAAFEEKRTEGVAPEKRYEENGKVEEVAMHVLQDEGKSCFAAIIASSRFTDGAGGGVEEKRAVIGFTVRAAGGPKAKKAKEDQKGWGQRAP